MSSSPFPQRREAFGAGLVARATARRQAPWIGKRVRSFLSDEQRRRVRPRG